MTSWQTLPAFKQTELRSETTWMQWMSKCRARLLSRSKFPIKLQNWIASQYYCAWAIAFGSMHNKNKPKYRDMRTHTTGDNYKNDDNPTHGVQSVLAKCLVCIYVLFNMTSSLSLIGWLKLQPQLYAPLVLPYLCYKCVVVSFVIIVGSYKLSTHVLTVQLRGNSQVSFTHELAHSAQTSSNIHPMGF